MMRKFRTEAIFTAVSFLLIANLACNLSTPRGPITQNPSVATAVETANGSQVTVTTNAAPAEPTGIGEGASTESPSSVNGNSSEPAGSGSSVNSDGDVTASVSIKNGSATYNGQITFPGKDTSDEIYIKPVDFDSTKTSGNLNFTLTCSGRGKAKVNYKGGAITSGSPGCGETWTAYVIVGSPDSHITIHLDATGQIDWTLSVTGS